MTRSGNRCAGRGRGLAGGLTLVELVTTLAISSVLFLALGNAIFIATKALPGKDDPSFASVQAAQTLDLIAAELEAAVYVSALTSRSVAFTVADRNADGEDERIAYAWSGVPGEPLVRTYNGVSWNVMDSVGSFNLAASVRHVSETYPLPGIEDVAPSVLVDNTVLLSLNSDKFSGGNSKNFGQYFAPAFSSDVIGWRPTSVLLWASLDRTPGTFKVQMREASSSMLPRTGVIEERTINSSTLPLLLFLAQTYTFSAVPRQAPGNALCTTLMWGSGSGPGKFQTTRSNDKMLSTNSSPTDWSVSATQCIQSQLYGVPMRAGLPTTCTTRFLLNLGVTLAPASGPAMRTTALTLNHPEVLSGYWELRFDRDPTTLNLNGDASKDWTLSPGPTFNTGQLAAGVWTTSSSDALVTQPASDFAKTTIVDVRMQAVTAGASAVFTINAARSDDYCVGLMASLKLESDGTQTLTLQQKTGASSWGTLVVFGQLPAQATDLHLIIDPAAMGVNVSINGAQRGTFPVVQFNLPGADRAASIYASGGTAKFSNCRIRVLGDAP